MQALVAKILTVLVLIHTVCGCCPRSAAATLTGHVASHACSCCDGDAEGSSDRGAPAKGKTLHRCELCAYLTSPRVDIDQSCENVVTWLDPRAFAISLSATALPTRLCAEPPSAAAPRLHLTLQILLI